MSTAVSLFNQIGAVGAANPLATQDVAVPVAGDGVALRLNSLTQTLAYDGSGRLSTITVTQDGAQYQQTLGYDGATTRLTSVSAWVKL
jgi:YD repeat-containing protein